MTNASHLRVASPPPKPLLIWDGECHFCRRWIERWRELTRGTVDYATYQETADRFPEIPREQFQKSVVLVDKDGKVFFAAEAIYRSLGSRCTRRWLAWSYDHIPGFASVSEFAYRIVARNRSFSSAVTRMLWGDDVRPPKYLWARRWFLRLLGVVYLSAFVSLWTQIDGLVGANGIAPVPDYPAARGQVDWHAYLMAPTLCWFNSSNAFLHYLCGGGVIAALLLIVGVAPILCLIILFVFYLSLTVVGEPFLNFQWDILLLEAGFLSIFVAPWQVWPRRGHDPPVSRPALFLLKFLLFKLMIMSGVVKLTSGDDCWGWINHSFHWSALTALDYHYWSQPLPTVFAWWADKHPEWFKHFSVAFCLFVEIIVPVFVWAPRRPRLVAAGLLILLQIAIAVTGNYCFFNLLTIALCLLLIDDATFRRAVAAVADRGPIWRWSMLAPLAVIVVTLPLNTWLIFTAFKPRADWPWPRALRSVYQRVGPFYIANGYGLFRVMTKDRREIVIEGSADGIDWLPYEFKWKPGDVKRPPGWCAPHQPRLDWQMWFAALGTPQQNPWVVRLLVCLLENKRDVTQLFERNPFPETPPRYIRAMFYRYRFTTATERRETGAWWKRQELREYLPGFSLAQVR